MYIGRREIKFNPLALISGCFWMVPGLLIGQLYGTSFPLAYALGSTVCFGLLSGLLGYIFNARSPQTALNLYHRLAVSIALILGAVCGGANIGTILFLFKILLPTKLALALGVVLGSILASTIIQILIKYQKINTPNSIIVIANSFIGMILMSCFGTFYGPAGWGLGLDIGVILGFTAGRFAIKIKNNSNDLAKILSSLYAISGMLIGIMFGTIFNAYFITVIPQALIYTGFGFLFMGSAAWIGSSIGNNIKFNPECALYNAVSRHRIYQATLLIPFIFTGYLAGGVLGLYYCSLPQIVLCQAYGTVIAGTLYAATHLSYFLIQEIKNKLFTTYYDPEDCHECFPTPTPGTPAAVVLTPCVSSLSLTPCVSLCRTPSYPPASFQRNINDGGFDAGVLCLTSDSDNEGAQRHHARLWSPNPGG